MTADDNGLRRSVAHTIAFMRMAAIELRRIADQLDADSDDLEQTAGPGTP